MTKAKPTKRRTPGSENHRRLIILGSGPAGLSAALYAARAELKPLLLTGMELHGQAGVTFMIENYPGFPEGIGGSQLGELFIKQAEKFGTEIFYETAESVDLSSRPFKVTTYGKTYTADSLILSTGAGANHLNVPGERELTGKGVSYCATCDGWFFKDKAVAIIGGGDSALEEALFMTRYASAVTLIHRRGEFRAAALLQQRVHENPRIQLIMNHVVTAIQGDEAVTGLRIKDVLSGDEKELVVEGIFVFIGHTPNTALFKGQLSLDEQGYIVVNALMETNIPGVYAAGEVADRHFRQVVTSAGMGAAAAIQAARFLENK
jgi:thioredoxin reductase (NADPH)